MKAEVLSFLLDEDLFILVAYFFNMIYLILQLLYQIWHMPVLV